MRSAPSSAAARHPMDKSLYLQVLEVVGFVTTVALPLMGFLVWLKIALLVAAPGGVWSNMSGRSKGLLLLVLVSPLAGGWLVSRLMTL